MKALKNDNNQTKSKKTKYKFVPNDYAAEASPIDASGFSDEQVEKIKAEVAQEESKKVSKLQKISAIWTIISTIYAIASTCTFIARGWIEHTLTYVIIALLAVYVAVFIALVVLLFKDPKKIKINLKTYKTLLKIFKAVVNVAFLSLSAVSMAGISSEGMSISKWVLFGLTFLVAVVQLGLKVSLFVLKLIRKRLAKNYKVKISRFVDGKKKHKNLVDSIEEKSYK